MWGKVSEILKQGSHFFQLIQSGKTNVYKQFKEDFNLIYELIVDFARPPLRIKVGEYDCKFEFCRWCPKIIKERIWQLASINGHWRSYIINLILLQIQQLDDFFMPSCFEK